MQFVILSYEGVHWQASSASTLEELVLCTVAARAAAGHEPVSRLSGRGCPHAKTSSDCQCEHAIAVS